MIDSSDQQSRHLDDADIGTRLKCIREHNGLSQRELAKRAGVPHSSISMIEQGQNSPSINSLAKILGGIPMSLAHFFSCDLLLLSQQIYRAYDLAINQQMVAQGLSRQKIPLQNNTQLQFSRYCYAPGADSGDVPTKLNTHISGFVLSGDIELTINTEVSSLGPGDAFYLAPQQIHRLRNVSDENCILLACEF